MDHLLPQVYLSCAVANNACTPCKWIFKNCTMFENWTKYENTYAFRANLSANSEGLIMIMHNKKNPMFSTIKLYIYTNLIRCKPLFICTKLLWHFNKTHMRVRGTSSRRGTAARRGEARQQQKMLKFKFKKNAQIRSSFNGGGCWLGGERVCT
jgi:hypothetical protein